MDRVHGRWLRTWGTGSYANSPTLGKGSLSRSRQTVRVVYVLKQDLVQKSVHSVVRAAGRVLMLFPLGWMSLFSKHDLIYLQGKETLCSFPVLKENAVSWTSIAKIDGDARSTMNVPGLVSSWRRDPSVACKHDEGSA